jgi:hypothetical protein
MNQRLSNIDASWAEDNQVLSQENPIRKSATVVIQEDYFKSGGQKGSPVDQSHYVEKTGSKIICDKYFKPVT